MSCGVLVCLLWFVASPALGLILGRVIRERDRRG